MEEIIALILTPISLLNLLGGVVGGVWLLFRGEWKFVLFWFFASLIFPWVHSIVIMILGWPFGMAAVYFGERKKIFLSTFFGFLSLTINNIVNLIWVTFILYIMGNVNGWTVVPYLLFGYAIATGPFAYMATHEPPDSLGTTIGLLIVQIAYLIGGILALVYKFQYYYPVVLILLIISEIILLKLHRALIKEAIKQEKELKNHSEVV